MEQFGKYTLVKKIGTGGMAEVFLARTTVAQGLNKTLVIKKIHPAFARSRQFVAMFVDEAKIALGLNHPSIIQVFDFGAVGDTYFLAMEYVEGCDLLRLLQDCAAQRRRIPYGISAYVVQQVAKGLDYAHRKTDEFGESLAIVHRDISPQNVLLSWDGGVKIVDFGIARARDVHEDEGVIKGKFSYMSPEQARGEPVDCRSDVFAAGIVLYEMVCARPLFPGKGKEALELVKSGVIPRPRDFAPELPESLERIILTALAFHRDDRFQTGRDMQHELVRFALEWAQKTGDLVDSGGLAQFLSTVVPAERRSPPPRPPAESLRRAAAAAGDAVPRAIVVPEPSAARESARNISVAAGVPSLGALGDEAPAPEERESAARGDAGGGGAGSVASALGEKPSRIESPPARTTDVRERKYVYVVEGVVRGSAALERRLGREGAARLVAEFYAMARDVAFKHEASIDLPGEGDGGVTDVGESGIRCVIGLPVASEDDAGRTIRLALALVDALDGVGSDVEPELRLAVGVQRGVAMLTRRSEPSGTGTPRPALAGHAGEPGKGGMAATGFELEDATATFARRLARQARGAEILVGGRVFRAARSEWNFEALPAIELSVEPDVTGPGSKVEDETDPGVKRARVYRLRGPKERAQRLRERSRTDGRTHGRDLELKAMRDAYRDVLVTKRKRQVVIVGDTGVGKRTLVAAFVDSLPPGEAVVVRASTRVGTAMTPYAVIADLARDVLGLAEDAEPHEVERRLLRALPLVFPGEEQSREARGALQTVGMLLGARGTTAAAAEIDADERRQRLLQILQRVEQRMLAPHKPLVVIGEDVHWADQESQDLFLALLKVDTSRPILGIMTTRSDQRILRAAGELGSEVIHLDELSPEARRQMIADRFVPGADAGDLIEQIVVRAGGNPFFINEILDQLLERGVVVADGEADEHPGLLRWIKRDAQIQVPSSIEDALATRFDGLPPADKETLLAASVLGRNFTAAAVSALLFRPARLELDELVRRGILAPHEGEYSFKNEMTMTVAYGLVAPDVRAKLHREAATRIAGAAGYRPGHDDAIIARHLELAGDHSPAADRYLRAANHAIDVGGNTDAFRQLTRALKLLSVDDHERRFTAHRQREEILRRLARRPQQLREIHALRREAEAMGEPAKLAFAHAALAQFYIDVGKAPAASRAVAPALQYARESGDKLAEADALRLRSVIARLVGNNEESLRLAEQALGLCAEVDGERERRGDARTADPRGQAAVLRARATILNGRGTTLWSMGRLEASIESYAEALVIYRALGMPRLEARALNNMGIVFAALGEYEEALAHYKSALKIDQTLGDRAGVALKLGNIGQCYADLGDVDRAESYLAKALKLAEQTGDLSAAADAAISLGQTRIQRGLHADALDMLEKGLAFATENRERYQEIRALEYLALGQLLAGHSPEGALELARSATDLARKMPMLVGIMYGLSFQGLALSRMGVHDDAAAATEEAVALLAEQGRPEGAEHILRWHAEVLAAAGRTADAAAARGEAKAAVDAKAARLRDPGLRASFLASRDRAV
jgi:tetratricopeptide (TPR) repeat protein/tRNA A-37 threonylcarbamoyl transferase component Bud32